MLEEERKVMTEKHHIQKLIQIYRSLHILPVQCSTPDIKQELLLASEF
jgi:hypothetical protein